MSPAAPAPTCSPSPSWAPPTWPAPALESRGEPGDRADRLVVAATMRRLGAAGEQFSYEHLRPHEEPALWIADAVAWCHGAGGEWRRRIAPLVKDVVRVAEAGRRPQ